jgi:hypothetical protein
MRLSWDDLDEQGCAEHGSPDWNTMTVVGPTKIRDARGNVTLQWTVTVHCEQAPPATPVTPLPVPEARVAELEPVEPPPPVGAAA